MRKDEVVTNFKKLLNIVEEQDIADQIYLPITHVPDLNFIDDIVDARFLKCSKGNKPYDDEDLLFFTYGRNAFIPRDEKEAENMIYPPLVFLMDPRLVKGTAKRMLPFDSGAFKSYGVPSNIPITKFEIEHPSGEDYLKLVVLLYKNYNNYIKFKHDFEELVKKYTLFPALRILEEIYTKQLTENSPIGPQGRSIEIHYGEPVPLEPWLILYPHNFANEKYDPSQLKLAFPTSTIRMYTADTTGGGGSRKHRDSINKEIRDFIKEKATTLRWNRT